MSTPAILYDNRFDDGVQVATTTDAGFDEANLEDWKVFTKWRPTSTVIEQTITVDCGSAKSADSLGIENHDLFTQNATISVEYSSDNFAADTNVALSGFIPTSDDIVYKEFTTQSARYWRFKIATGYTAAPTISILVIGERLQFPFGVHDNNYDPDSYTIIAETQIAESGHLLGIATSYKRLELAPEWKFLASSFVDGDLTTFIDTHELKPFFWVWDFSGHATDLFLVRIPPNFRKKFPFSKSTTHRNVKLNFTGVL